MNKTFTVFLFIVFFFKVSSVFSQNLSLKETKEKAFSYKKEDTVKLKMLLNISYTYVSQQVDSAIKYGLQAKTLANKLGYKKFEFTAYEYLGQAYAGKGNFKEATVIFQKQEQLATTPAEKARTIRNQGNIAIELGRPAEALNLYFKSLDLANQSGEKLSAATALSNIAFVYRQQAKFEDAIVYLIKASKIGEELKDKRLSAVIFIQLALIQYNRKIYADARNYAEQALELYTQLNNKGGMASSYAIIGGCYSEKNDFVNANKYITKAYEINLALGDKRQIATTAQNLADIAFELKDYNKALTYSNLAINGLKEMNVIINLIGSYVSRAKIYIVLKEFGNAEEDVNQALSLSKSGNYRHQLRRAIEALALLKSAQGSHVDAFELILKANQLNDSLLNETNSKQINELRTKYETEKKLQEIKILSDRNKLQTLHLFNNKLEIEKQNLAINNQKLELSNKNLKLIKTESDVKQKLLETKQQREKIKTLNQQSVIQNLNLRQRNIYLSIAISLLIIGAILGYLFYNSRKLKAQAKLQEEINRQQDLAAKAVLDAEERERRRIAGDLHDGVGQTLSAALMGLNALVQKLGLEKETALQAEQAISLVNDSYDEMRSISHQMMPNALIKSGLASAVKEFLNKIDKDVLKVSLETIGLKERINEQTETVLYRVIQETVNNVIKHSGANKLHIVIIKDDDGVSATVEDNGLGFDKSKVNLKDGIGISNIYSRVEFLKGTVDIDSSPGKGTLVAIHIPN